MAENHAHQGDFTYTASPDTWVSVMVMANYILTASSVERDNGSVEAEWDSDFFGKRFLLRSWFADGKLRYGLRFYDQFAPADEAGAYIGFQGGEVQVDTLLDDAVGMYREDDPNAAFEHAEMDLRSYLATHEMVAA